MTISVIIPTKNRPELLVRTVESLLAQTVPAAELILVDQSDEDRARAPLTAVVAAVAPERRPRLHHVWDPSINGAAAARNVGLDLASGDVMCFCDDDVLPAPDVFERLLAHYARNADVAGLAPVIVNYTAPRSRFFDRLFFRGPFYDERQEVYWFWRDYKPDALVPVRMFTGAMMSFRREVIGTLRFDRRYCGPSVGEDIDFCWTLVARGARLALAIDAHLVHDRAPRPSRRPEATILTSWGYLFEKHVPKTPVNRLAFAWFVLGIVTQALQGALRERRLEPLRSAAEGLFSLTHDYAGSNFLMPRAGSRAQAVSGGGSV